MKNKLLFTFVAIAASLTLGSTALASTGTFRDGPYSSTSDDSGTCGNTWAWDLFTRNFTVSLPANPDTTYNVVEKFAKGHFLTIDGDSPGGCDTNPGGHIREGVSGTFNGTLGIVVSGGVFNPNGSCIRNTDGQCTTSGWVHGFFGGAATYDTPTFSFIYKAPNQGLIYHQWTNSSAGNSGDIASS